MSTKKVIIVNGFPNSGKTTLVSYVKKHLYCKNKTVLAISSIDPIVPYFNWLLALTGKSPIYRAVLSIAKKIAIRYKDIPLKYVLDQVNLGYDYVIVDIREPNEIDKLKKVCPCEVVTVLVKSKRASVTLSNEADRGVNNFTYDVVVHNDGTFCDLEMEAVRLSRYIVYKLFY